MRDTPSDKPADADAPYGLLCAWNSLTLIRGRSRRPPKRFVIVPLVAILLGCDSGPQHVELATDQTAYSVGDTGLMIVRNFGPRTIAWNCMQLQQLVDGAWQGRGLFPPGTVCIEPIGTPFLEPGATWSGPFQVLPEAFTVEGDYRFSIFVYDEGGYIQQLPEVFSNTFAVAN